MSGIKKSIDRLLSQKPGFWIFQIVGWSLFMLMDFIVSFHEISQLKSPYFWALSFITGMFISLILRYLYKRLFFAKKGKLNIYLIAVTIPVFSLLAAMLWALIRFAIIDRLELLYMYGIDFSIRMPTSSTFLYVTEIINYTWPLLIWSALYFGIKFWLSLIEANELHEKISLLAQQAELQMLRYQLNPHFLFNSLNSIQTLIHEDPTHAEKMISELSEFLRYTLRDKDRLFIPLSEEVNIVEKYLSMEKTRFPDRLEYDIDVSPPASKVEIISFILQPFIENAIKHGMKSSPLLMKVNVKGYIRDKRLFIEVTNNGRWIENNSNSGMGIKNVYDRLKHAYPDKHGIKIIKDPDYVRIVIDIAL